MTQTPDPFVEKLNDYLDGALDARAARELEQHLKGCESCRVQLGELRDLQRLARELPRVEPPELVWSAVSRELRRRMPGVSTSVSTRSWASFLYPALAIAAALLLGVALFLSYRAPASPGDADRQALANMVTEELRAAETHYDKAIGGLEQIIQQNDGVLPEDLKSVLNQNLDLIQGAIDESREALATEPDSTVAQDSLLEALRRKVTLLQNTILLINEVRKGQGENALDIIDQMRKTTDPS